MLSDSSYVLQLERNWMTQAVMAKIIENEAQIEKPQFK